MHDVRGLEITTASGAAALSYDAAMASFLDYRLDTMALARMATAADKHFCLAHCLRGYLLLLAGSTTVREKVAAALADARAGVDGATARERWHVDALHRWNVGDLVGANATWERILFEHPLDLLALRLHHLNSFWTGQARALRAMPAAVLRSWTEATPGFGSVLGMLAFGFGENGEYALAERHGRRAVELAPDDLWALHSVAHVLEMQGRNDEGRAWLARPLDHWDDRNPFKRHLWWHLALFMLDDGQYDAALDLYDTAVGGMEPGFYLDLQNAASLLARLEFCGLGVGGRWQALADHAEANAGDHALVFTDIHRVMSLARESRFGVARQLVASMEAYAAQDRSRYASSVIDRLGVGLCQGIIAFEEGRYGAAVDQMLPLRHLTGPIGASQAQREILDDYLVEATRRSGSLVAAGRLLEERLVLKPRSRSLAERLARVGERDPASRPNPHS